MIRTTPLRFAFFCLLAALGVVGCGGGGGSSVPSVYRGTWYGGFVDGDGALNVIEMTVSGSGTVSGQARSPGSGSIGAPITTLSGKLATAGSISLKLRHPDGSTQTVSGATSMAPNGAVLTVELVPDPTKPNDKITIEFDRSRATDIPGPLGGEIQIQVAPGDVRTMPLQSARGAVGGRLAVTVQTPEGPVAVEARLGEDAAGANRRIIGWSADGRVFFGTYTAGADSLEAEVDLQWEENGEVSSATATISMHR